MSFGINDRKRVRLSSAWFFRWQPLAAASCVAVLVAGLLVVKTRQQDDEQQQILAMAERVYTSPDYTVIGNLDELIDSEKNSAWLTADVK